MPALHLLKCIPTEHKDHYEKLTKRINENLKTISNIKDPKYFSAIIREAEDNFLKQIQKMFTESPLNQLPSGTNWLEWFSYIANSSIKDKKELSFSDFLVQIEQHLPPDKLPELQKQYLSIFKEFNRKLDQINNHITKIIAIIQEISDIRKKLSVKDHVPTPITRKSTLLHEDSAFSYRQRESSINSSGSQINPRASFTDSSASSIDSSGSQLSSGSVGHSNSSLSLSRNVPEEKTRLIEGIKTIAKEKEELFLETIVVELSKQLVSLKSKINIEELLSQFLSGKPIQIQGIEIPPQKDFLDFLKVLVHLNDIFKNSPDDDQQRVSLHELEYNLKKDDEKQKLFSTIETNPTYKQLVAIVERQEKSLNDDLTATLEKTIDSLSLPQPERSRTTAPPKLEKNPQETEMEVIQERKILFLENIARELSRLEPSFQFDDIMKLLSNYLSQKPVVLYDVTFPVETKLLDFLKVVSLLGDTFKTSNAENVHNNLRELQQKLANDQTKQQLFAVVENNENYKTIVKTVAEQAEILEKDRKEISDLTRVRKGGSGFR